MKSLSREQRALLEEVVRRGITLPTAQPIEGPRLSFREFVTKVRPGFRWYRHCELIAGVLQRVADGELRRVLIFLPPRHGKSELASRLFTAYWLYRFPHRWVGLGCYGAELANTLSRSSRENFRCARGAIGGNTEAVKHWETAQGGGMWAAGVGGPMLGKGWHLGVIDDPAKNFEEAMSELVQEGHRDWYRSTFLTREEPDPTTGEMDGAVIVVAQRWCETDLPGWLLSEESTGDEMDAEHWHVVSLEAIKEEAPPEVPATCTLEPDWRQPGEALCPERRPAGKLRRLLARIGDYFFAAIYQQRPVPRKGQVLDPSWFEVVEAAPANATRLRYWDKAGTADGGAYTAGVLMSWATGGLFTIEDVVRGQWSAPDRERTIKQTAEIDGRDVRVVVEQEPGSGGQESAENTIRRLAGWSVAADRVTGGKVLRAEPLASQAKAGNVRLLRAPWNQPFLDEARRFPMGKNKDQIDAAAGALNKLSALPPDAEIDSTESPFSGREWGT